MLNNKVIVALKAIMLTLIVVAGCQLQAADESPAIEVMQDYLDFTGYADGIVSPEQLASIDIKNIIFVDTRNKEQYELSHIANAINIEWRQIINRRAEIPTNKTVVLYCDTGMLSSRAYFALKMSGAGDNIKVISGGYEAWQKYRKQK